MATAPAAAPASAWPPTSTRLTRPMVDTLAAAVDAADIAWTAGFTPPAIHRMVSVRWTFGGTPTRLTLSRAGVLSVPDGHDHAGPGTIGPAALRAVAERLAGCQGGAAFDEIAGELIAAVPALTLQPPRLRLIGETWPYGRYGPPADEWAAWLARREALRRAGNEIWRAVVGDLRKAFGEAPRLPKTLRLFDGALLPDTAGVCVTEQGGPPAVGVADHLDPRDRQHLESVMLHEGVHAVVGWGSGDSDHGPAFATACEQLCERARPDLPYPPRVAPAYDWPESTVRAWPR